MSLGSRSGVNCTRLKMPPTAAARARQASVLATPGIPSSSTCPSASRPITNASTTSGWPMIVRASASRTSCGVLTRPARVRADTHRAGRADRARPGPVRAPVRSVPVRRRPSSRGRVVDRAGPSARNASANVAPAGAPARAKSASRKTSSAASSPRARYAASASRTGSRARPRFGTTSGGAAAGGATPCGRRRTQPHEYDDRARQQHEDGTDGQQRVAQQPPHRARVGVLHGGAGNDAHAERLRGVTHAASGRRIDRVDVGRRERRRARGVGRHRQRFVEVRPIRCRNARACARRRDRSRSSAWGARVRRAGRAFRARARAPSRETTGPDARRADRSAVRVR